MWRAPGQKARVQQLDAISTETTYPAPASAGAAKGPGKAGSKGQQAFQRGLAALAQWVEREGQRPVPRWHSEQITVDSETEPVAERLGVWVSNTKSRRAKLAQEQLDALRELGMEWA
ncbi:helicase associated domain-containing protein [Streptomyces sp. CB01635]|uniref:helicase associated domain-containing protein n=1 Tax=Streptomyces sp. CB01635 TaxID=2020326 RepID=UPI003FA3CAE6